MEQQRTVVSPPKQPATNSGVRPQPAPPARVIADNPAELEGTLNEPKAAVSGKMRVTHSPSGAKQQIVCTFDFDHDKVRFETEAVPAITGENPHKVDYGLNKNQANSLRFIRALSALLEKSGFIVEAV